MEWIPNRQFSRKLEKNINDVIHKAHIRPKDEKL